jgi:hypothetical protein
MELECGEIDYASDVSRVRESLCGGYTAIGVSDHNDRPANGCGCLRDYFSVGMHVPQGGWVITAACQRHGVHVDIRQFVYERTQVVGLVPGTWDEEQ